MKILFAEDDLILRELFTFAVEAELSCDIIEVSSGKEAIKYLEEQKDIQTVICDFNMPEGGADVVYQHIRKECPHIPFVLFSSVTPEEKEVFSNFYSDHPHNYYLQKPCGVPEFLAAIRDSTGISPREELPEFCRVRPFRFLKMTETVSDIYIKISENKYIKVLNRGEFYGNDIIEKYIKREVEYLYVKKEDYFIFSENFCHVIINALEASSQNLSLSVENQLSSISFVHDTVRSLGLTPLVVKTVETTANSCISFIKRNENIYKIFNEVAQKRNFVYEHSILTAYISAAMAFKMDWFTHPTLQKLTMASLLHDVFLSTVEGDWQRLESADPSSVEILDWKQKQKFYKHPSIAAELVKTMKDLPSDVDWIILYHHERPDGNGFPFKIYATQTPPISCVFNIAESFAQRVWGKTINEELVGDVLKDFKTYFDKGNYKKPLDALIKLFEK